ncbi:MAG: hypothetical protein KF862_27550 [Chitinophagaceae bacterium]|nr:hypothetical protein [Chitinophagaceae bacterium]
MLSDIIVEDNRFDTSTLGFMHKGSVDMESLIKFKNGFSNEICNYLVNSIDRPDSATSTTSYKLICFIKKLWLTDEIYEKEEKKNLPASIQSGIIFRAEYWVEKENVYIPLYRFDTTITRDKNIYRSGNNYIEEALMFSLSKLSSFTENKIEQIKSKYSRSEIEQNNKRRFDLPILTDTLRRGIYITFEEFKNNQPSIKEFTIKPDKKDDALYVTDEKGKEVLLRELYGYTDGKDIFISSAGNFFRLYRSGNSFNVYGIKSLKKVRDLRVVESGVAGIGLGASQVPFFPTGTKSGYIYKLRPAPFQLDMETGEISLVSGKK